MDFQSFKISFERRDQTPEPIACWPDIGIGEYDNVVAQSGFLQRGAHPRVAVLISAQAELGEDRVDVFLHGMLADHELIGDGGVGAALGDGGEHLLLARAEPLDPGVARAGPSAHQRLDVAE